MRIFDMFLRLAGWLSALAMTLIVLLQTGHADRIARAHDRALETANVCIDLEMRRSMAITRALEAGLLLTGRVR